MKTYVVTYVVEVKDEDEEGWSEQSDIPMTLMYNIQQGDGHFVGYTQVENNSQDKYAFFDESGSI